MRPYTIPLTLIEGYQPQMTILAASDKPQLEVTKEVILKENYVL